MDLPLETPLSPTTSYSLDEYRATYRESKPNVRRIFVESCSKTSPCRDAPHWEEEEKGSRAATTGETGSGCGTTSEAQDVDSDELTNEQVSEILSSTL